MQSVELLTALTGAKIGKEHSTRGGTKYELFFEQLHQLHKAIRILQTGGYAASRASSARNKRDYRVIINFSNSSPDSVQDDYYGDLTPKSPAGPKDSLQKHVDSRFSHPTPDIRPNLPRFTYKVSSANTQKPAEAAVFYQAEQLYKEEVNLEDLPSLKSSLHKDGFENVEGPPPPRRKSKGGKSRWRPGEDDSWVIEAQV